MIGKESKYDIVFCSWCKMDMERQNARMVILPTRNGHSFDGETHYFCNIECQQLFESRRIRNLAKLKGDRGVF